MEKYNISKEILSENVTNEEIDESLDNFAEELETDEDRRVLITYALQCFYRSGKDTFTEDELETKLSNLILDRIAYNLEKIGFIDSTIDSDGEVSYSITPEGKDYLDDNL